MLLDASKHLIHPLLMHFHCLFHQRCQRCCKWHLDVTLAGAGAGATKQNRTPQPKQTAKNPTKTLPPPPPPPKPPQIFNKERLLDCALKIRVGFKCSKPLNIDSTGCSRSRNKDPLLSSTKMPQKCGTYEKNIWL